MPHAPKYYFVYITCNYNRTVLYAGVTNLLEQRIVEHYLDRIDKKTFAGKYQAYWLLYYEQHGYVLNAISREKEIKGWRREKKMALIRSFNPELKLLNKELFGCWPPKETWHRKEPE